MAKLWMPEVTEYPDVNNLFDMAYHMQETLLTLADSARDNHAEFALRSLGESLDDMTREEREVSLLADTAFYDAPDNAFRFVYDIGVRGIIDGIRYVRLQNMSLGLSLTVQTSETFSPRNPDFSEPTDLNLSTPIIGVQYIETAA